MGGEGESFRRSLNPLVLQMQKMELELKCLECLDLLSSPILMPCDHIFCSCCIATFTETVKCPVCMLRCFHKDVRSAAHMEKMVNIYKCMKAIVSANLLQQEPSVNLFETKKPSRQDPVSSNKNADIKLEEEPVGKLSGKKSSTVHSNILLSGSLNAGNPGCEAEIQDFGTYGNKKWESNSGEEAFLGQFCETYSPPSFGNIKDSDYEGNDEGNEHRIKRSLDNSLLTKELEVETNHTKKNCVIEPKKQKLSNEHDVGDTRGGVDSRDFPIINSQSENNSEKISASVLQAQRSSKYSVASTLVVCAFCHSFRTTEASGQFVHYLEGKQIEVDEASLPNVVHVHQKCIDWAPQVYFNGDIAMNLEAELSRASRLKCWCCGRKGAALGCYVKSCRKSFHVPCAVETIECRWDCENYLVLCPAHSARKLPCDGPTNKKKNKASGTSNSIGSSGGLTSATTQQCNERGTDSSFMSRDWVLCGSALSKEEKLLLDEFTELSGAPLTNSWKQNVTHVIASTDERGACSRTLKVLMAILSGRWVLSIDWIKDCMKAGHPVEEEPYEISHDVHGCFDGPKNGRIRTMEKAPKLFSGLGFYFSGYFTPCYKGYLEDLITTAGGTFKNKNDLPTDQDNSSMFVVYSVEPPQGCDPVDLNEVIVKRTEEAESFATKIGARAVAHTWLLDTIAGCNLQLDQ